MKHENISKHRANLPIAKSRKEIVKLISENPTTIIIGETGCGKSTQVPQFLVDSEEFRNVNIAITQPRRVSACSLARRVAFERHGKVGREVGYNVRFDNMSNPKTHIKYLTDGMLLREILLDSELSNYSIVILDEIHERTVQTDLLIGLLKDLQKRRDLKIVLMSATLHCKLFVDFFDNPPIIHVRGRMFPVGIFYTDQPESDYVDACSIAIVQLHLDLDPGDFLVFMTGQEEIEELAGLLRTKDLDPPLYVLPLYAALPMSQQQKIFDPAPENSRKVILSTNIAETSVTIPGIKYVIDSGLVKVKSYNPITGVEVLNTSPISKAQAMQRSGRAGREFAGGCFRLYTEEAFFDLADSPVAEIRRADLSSVCLQLLAIGIENPVKFEFLERPPTSLLMASLNTIYGLGAMDNSGKLTDDGKIMASFPLSPKMTKILLLASRSGCGNKALTLMSMMSCENLFVTPSEQRKKARNQHKLFMDSTGDHITLIHIYDAYLNAIDKHKFCMKNFLSQRALEYAVKVREQLKEVANEMNVDLSEDEEDEGRLDRLRKCLADALHENVARHIVSGKYQCLEDGTEIHIHPSSFAFNRALDYIVFSERVMTKKLYARWVSQVEPPTTNEQSTEPP
ncbi:putative ATP-dependent RNA helicase DHX35 [Histomonas meleagridis]|uniref:putative ATP-dependent RNA helicase DHX35 n=1 Tax=Histomonas meleagridis TaxID=135588 RepID=UPI00355A9B64|nr:putative ATP-dependent RNA helicase DHX35 [Histomonas meleagridis]KAH0802498.1 putative ATP-dependent RNA helicase DHX35 [Histomonas meleagridis]